MKKTWTTVLSVVFAYGTLTASHLAAQPSIEPGTAEVVGGIGLSGGIGSLDEFMNIFGLAADLRNLLGTAVTVDPGSNTAWNAGLSAGYAVKRDLMVTAEVVRTRLVDPTLIFSPPSTISSMKFKASLVELTAGLQYQIPTRASSVVPFLGGGVGLARSLAGLNESPFNVLKVKLSDDHLALNFGGGARIYLSLRWGFRPELKVVYIPGQAWVRTSLGVFFQFGQ